MAKRYTLRERAYYPFMTPFGLLIALVAYPAHLPYEATTQARMYGPALKWDERR